MMDEEVINLLLRKRCNIYKIDNSYIVIADGHAMVNYSITILSEYSDFYEKVGSQQDVVRFYIKSQYNEEFHSFMVMNKL